MKGFLEKDK